MKNFKILVNILNCCEVFFRVKENIVRVNVKCHILAPDS